LKDSCITEETLHILAFIERQNAGRSVCVNTCKITFKLNFVCRKKLEWGSYYKLADLRM